MRFQNRCVLLAVVLCLVVNVAIAFADEATTVRFSRTQLDAKFRSEGVAVGDFNRDGKLDIAAGNVWYAAPDWKLHAIQGESIEYNSLDYSHSFINAADDLNGDGWDDLMVVDFPGEQTWWFENPQNASGPWKRHVITRVSNNESPHFVDVDSDGTRELVMGVAPSAKKPNDDRQMAILRPGNASNEPWRIRTISAKNGAGAMQYSHGLGVGDINGDGRNDVLVTEGWYEAPATGEASDWKFHPIDFGKPVSHMVVFDYDGDGDADIACASAHQIGIWWLEQTPDGWKTHEIDNSFSQTHSLCLADIDSDGLPDIVTGKRWWAHGPKKDAQPNHPAVLFWFELRREDGRPKWTPHEIDHDSGVGTQFEVTDINDDGLLDIVTSNKKGVYYFQQHRQ